MQEQTRYTPIQRRASLSADQTRSYPRSSIGTNAGLHRDDVPYTTDEDDYEETYPQLTPRSAIRYQPDQQVYTQGNKRLIVHRQPPPAAKQKPYWIVFVCTGMILMAGAFVAISTVGD